MPKTREAFGQNAAPDKIARPRAATRTSPGDRQRNFGQTAAPRAPLSRPPCVTCGSVVEGGDPHAWRGRLRRPRQFDDGFAFSRRSVASGGRCRRARRRPPLVRPREWSRARAVNHWLTFREHSVSIPPSRDIRVASSTPPFASLSIASRAAVSRLSFRAAIAPRAARRFRSAPRIKVKKNLTEQTGAKCARLLAVGNARGGARRELARA